MPLTTGGLRRLFDTEIRQPGRGGGATEVLHFDGLTLLTGPFNFVSWSGEGRTGRPEDVARLAGYFRDRNQSVIWRVYDDDEGAAELNAALLANGFRADPQGTLMAFELGGPFAEPATTVEIVRADSSESLHAARNVAARIFGGPVPTAAAEPETTTYLARINGRAAGSALLDHPAGSQAALLRGGCVLPEFRRQGLYRALTIARLAAANRMGAKAAYTDARETSRAVLEKLGFIALTRETTWTLDAEA